MARQYWLMKSEPEVYSIDHLKRDKSTLWSGVRNYQARNFMRDQMKVGDLVLFYHSNAEPSGVAGLATVSRTGLPDPTQFEIQSEYFDPKSKKDAPTWICVEVQFLKRFEKTLELAAIRKNPKLSGLLLLKKGQRLSVQPVGKRDFEAILAMDSQS